MALNAPGVATTWPNANNGFRVVGGLLKLSAMIFDGSDRVTRSDEVA